MGLRLESLGGSLETSKKVEHIDSIESLGLFEYPSSAAINKYLDTIGSARNIESFNTAFSRLSRCVEYAKTSEDCEIILRDIGIYERSVILSYDQQEALMNLSVKCTVKANSLKMEEELSLQRISKPLDYMDEFSEIDYSKLSSNPTTTDDDLDSLRELREILQQYDGSEPSKSKEENDLEIKKILDSLSSETLVDIVPTKEEKKAKVHVIHARKKKVPKRVRIRKITKPGLPGENLENETSNLTNKK